MKERRIDLRTEKTYDALVAAFEELMQEKSFEELTVRELCERARTRTATFYNHFSDKYDFFAFVAKRMRVNLSESAVNVSSTDRPEEYYENLFRNALDNITRNQKILANLQSDSLLTISMYNVDFEMEDGIREHIARDIREGLLPEGNAEILTQLLLGALSQIERWWYPKRKKISVQQVVDQVGLIVKSMYNAS